MKKSITTTLVLLLPLFALLQVKYPTNVETVLQKAGKNRPQLEKAIHHFATTKDSLKLKAIYFLIENMDIHYSLNYYWANEKGERIAYDELAYPDFDAALKVFDEIKQHTPGIHPVQVKYYDADTITADYLISNVELAFDAWRKPQAQKIDFNTFCEYILPYRVSTEPLQNWRNDYYKKFAWINDSTTANTTKEKLSVFAADYNKWFTNTYGIESRKEPLPRLGALQLLSRRKGPCEDIADLEVFTLRSQGMPATIDNIVCWATASGKHFLNAAFDENNNALSFDVSNPAAMYDRLAREPAKVLRTTYSKQPNTLAAIVDTLNIPQGLLRNQNYVDVTARYWATGNLDARLFPSKQPPSTAFACVLNFLNWVPAWWGNVTDNKVTFTNMCSGVVYLPMYYTNGKLHPAGWPVAFSSTTAISLQPDTINTRTISIYEQDKYLVFRPGKKYKLFYWNNKWQPLQELTAAENMKFLSFEKVPRNALLLLVPEYSQRKERPFTIADNGERMWW